MGRNTTEIKFVMDAVKSNLEALYDDVRRERKLLRQLTRELAFAPDGVQCGKRYKYRGKTIEIVKVDVNKQGDKVIRYSVVMADGKVSKKTHRLHQYRVVYLVEIE